MNKQTSQELTAEEECLRAVDGEKMWVVLNHVKPDRRNEFEHFIHQIIRPIAARSEIHVLNRSRILHPDGPNDDGTYTYVILLDPIVPDGVYAIDELLQQAYPPEEVEEISKLFTESLATPQVTFEVTQTAW